LSFTLNQLLKEQSEQRPNLHPAVRFVFAQGAITQSHKFSHPKGARNPAGAKVVINFFVE